MVACTQRRATSRLGVVFLLVTRTTAEFIVSSGEPFAVPWIFSWFFSMRADNTADSDLDPAYEWTWVTRGSPFYSRLDYLSSWRFDSLMTNMSRAAICRSRAHFYNRSIHYRKWIIEYFDNNQFNGFSLNHCRYQFHIYVICQKWSINVISIMQFHY